MRDAIRWAIEVLNAPGGRCLETSDAGSREEAETLAARWAAGYREFRPEACFEITAVCAACMGNGVIPAAGRAGRMGVKRACPNCRKTEKETANA